MHVDSAPSAHVAVSNDVTSTPRVESPGLKDISQSMDATGWIVSSEGA